MLSFPKSSSYTLMWMYCSSKFTISNLHAKFHSGSNVFWIVFDRNSTSPYLIFTYGSDLPILSLLTSSDAFFTVISKTPGTNFESSICDDWRVSFSWLLCSTSESFFLSSFWNCASSFDSSSLMFEEEVLGVMASTKGTIDLFFVGESVATLFDSRFDFSSVSAKDAVSPCCVELTDLSSIFKERESNCDSETLFSIWIVFSTLIDVTEDCSVSCFPIFSSSIEVSDFKSLVFSSLIFCDSSKLSPFLSTSGLISYFFVSKPINLVVSSSWFLSTFSSFSFDEFFPSFLTSNSDFLELSHSSFCFISMSFDLPSGTLISSILVTSFFNSTLGEVIFSLFSFSLAFESSSFASLIDWSLSIKSTVSSFSFDELFSSGASVSFSSDSDFKLSFATFLSDSSTTNVFIDCSSSNITLSSFSFDESFSSCLLSGLWVLLRWDSLMFSSFFKSFVSVLLDDSSDLSSVWLLDDSSSGEKIVEKEIFPVLQPTRLCHLASLSVSLMASFRE